MTISWKPNPGTGVASPLEGSVIVNVKDSWDLEVLESFSVAYESLKDELDQEKIHYRSKAGLKRINELVDQYTKDTSYVYFKRDDRLYYPVDQAKDKCSWLRFATTQYVTRTDRYLGCAYDDNCTKNPIITHIPSLYRHLYCRVHAEENAKKMQEVSLDTCDLKTVYLEEYGEEFVVREGVYFSFNPHYKADPEYDYEERAIISISFDNDRLHSWGDIHPCFVLPLEEMFVKGDGADIIQDFPVAELRPDAHETIEKFRLQYSAYCADEIKRHRKKAVKNKQKCAEGDAKPLNDDELEDSIDTGIKAILMTDQTNDLVGSSKCAVDENGKVLNREPIRKMIKLHSLFVVDEHGRRLNLDDIDFTEVSSIKALRTAYDAHDYEKDGPAIFILRTSRDTDQDSAWLSEHGHQGYCTKNKIRNHIEDNHWRKGGGSKTPYSVATVTIYKDFLRAARDPKMTHRLNSSAFPAYTKRMWIHQTSDPDHWEAEATGARDKQLKKLAQRNEMRKERKRKSV